MQVCQYIYCKHAFPEGLSICPVCGYPVKASLGQDEKFIREHLPEVTGTPVIDMHQILISREGILDAQLEMMDLLHIEKALLQSVPSKVESMWSNRQLLEVKQKYSDRFIVSHFMDPRHPLARKRLKQYRERGIRVIKLLPCLGYQPDDARWNRFFETMDKLGLAAMVHTGFITARHKEEERRAGMFLHSKYGNPIFFDILARKYPRIQFILCHMGGNIWTDEALEMINHHENVWGDISGSGIGALKRILAAGVYVNESRLFWGNDSPPEAYLYNLKLLRSILKSGGRSELLPLLLYDNAARFIRDHLEI